MPPYKAIADIPEQTVEVGKKLEWMDRAAMVAADIHFWEQAVRTNLGVPFMPNLQFRDGRWRWQNEEGTITVITRLDGVIESVKQPIESCVKKEA
ncbi:MAG: hypothetical protein PHO20_05090 [Candidatus Peribacteraceae bacterium]|nr:hypothetical protein [Candidatus Peribacteraceae bacterium]MDD5740111.1 hypothetical protein [Candidatus Peribacteraceae bacterium]